MHSLAVLFWSCCAAMLAVMNVIEFAGLPWLYARRSMLSLWVIPQRWRLCGEYMVRERSLLCSPLREAMKWKQRSRSRYVPTGVSDPQVFRFTGTLVAFLSFSFPSLIWPISARMSSINSLRMCWAGFFWAGQERLGENNQREKENVCERERESKLIRSTRQQIRLDRERSEN